MDNFGYYFVLFTLIIVILMQAVERYFYGRQMQEELAKLIKAVLSKNVTEYTQAVRAEKMPLELPKDPDEVELTNADEEVFNKFIKNQ